MAPGLTHPARAYDVTPRAAACPRATGTPRRGPDFGRPLHGTCRASPSARPGGVTPGPAARGTPYARPTPATRRGNDGWREFPLSGTERGSGGEDSRSWVKTHPT